MKKVLIGVLLTAFALGGQTPLAKAEGRTSTTPTLDEVKNLIKNPTTSEEHLKLAGYFRREQAKLEESARIHDQLSQIYQFSKVPVPAVADRQRHCEDLVHSERNAASAARAMAEYYEEMAELTRKSR